VVYETNEVVTLTGGGTSENVNISLSNRGFSAKPDDGIVVVEDVLYAGFYDSQAAGSTSTNAIVKIFRNDGGVLGAGNLRLSGRFTDYT
jgi:ribosomal protein L18E